MQKIKDFEEQAKAALNVIADQGSELDQLRKKVAKMDSIIEGERAQFEEKARNQEIKYSRMEKEHEDLKGLLQCEMMKAEQACKQLETRFRDLPNPFEEEVLDLKEKYAETQRGVETMRLENSRITDMLEAEREKMGKEKQDLEEKLIMMSTVLNEMSP